LSISILVLAIAQVVILNKDSTTGEQLTKIYQNLDSVDEDITSLNQKIASESAYARITEKATWIGLTDSQKMISLTSPLPLAFSDLKTP
jgi:cell division protein FtsL